MNNPYDIINNHEVTKIIKEIFENLKVPYVTKAPQNLIEIPDTLNSDVVDNFMLGELFTQNIEQLRYMYSKIGECSSIVYYIEKEFDYLLNKQILLQDKERRKELDEAKAMNESLELQEYRKKLVILKSYNKMLEWVIKAQEKLVERISREQSARDKSREL